MIYEDLTITELQALPACQGTVTVRAQKRRKRAKLKKAQIAAGAAASSSSPLLDLLIKQCIICLAFIAVLTVINVFGFTNIVQGVVKIIDNHSITDILYGTMHV